MMGLALTDLSDGQMLNVLNLLGMPRHLHALTCIWPLRSLRHALGGSHAWETLNEACSSSVLRRRIPARTDV